MLFLLYIFLLRMFRRPDWRLLYALARVAHKAEIPVLLRPWQERSALRYSYMDFPGRRDVFIDCLILGWKKGMGLALASMLAHELGHALYAPFSGRWHLLEREEAAWIGAADLIRALGFQLPKSFEADREKCLKIYWDSFRDSHLGREFREEVVGRIPRLDLRDLLK